MLRGHAARAVVGSVAILGCVVAAASGASSPQGAVIKTKSSESYRPNKANPPNLVDVLALGWAPGTITVHSGEKLTVSNTDSLGDPHVLVIALKKDLPKAPLANPFANPAIKLAAPKILKSLKHPEAGFKAYKANFGPAGLNQEGDAIVIAPGGPHKSTSWFVSAKAGTTLYYFCAIHPWMQGKIKVIK